MSNPLPRSFIRHYRSFLRQHASKKKEYMNFVNSCSSVSIKVTCLSTDNYHISSEEAVIDLPELVELSKKKYVSLSIGIDQDVFESKTYLTHSDNVAEAGGVAWITAFFNKYEQLHPDYFLYSINIRLPSPKEEPIGEYLEDIYNIVLSSARSHKGSFAGNYFWSKRHSYEFYLLNYNWMMKKHKNEDLVDIFHHNFPENVIMNSDWADEEMAEKVDNEFHMVFFSGTPIYLDSNISALF